MPTRRALFTHWLPPILWMTLIFFGSGNTLSGAHTSRFVLPFLRWLLGGAFTPERGEEIHFLVRKLGHFTEYTVLSLLFWRALGSLPKFTGQMHQGWKFAATVALCTFYAASDEYHQSFIPARTANVSDVLIDTLGAALGLLILLSLARWAWAKVHSTGTAKLRLGP